MTGGPTVRAPSAPEERRNRAPWLLNARFLLLIGLGYMYLCFVVCIALGLTLIHPFFWGITIPGLLLLVRSVHLRIRCPEGPKLTREEAPELYCEVEGLATRLNLPRFHETQLVLEFNCGVMQIPLFGLIGWHRSYLQIGFPMLLATSPEQFRAILAHEFFHVFGGHGRLRNWTARVLNTWREILHRINTTNPRGDFLLSGFARWYVPRLERADSALSHRGEHGADAFAAAHTSAEAAAAALVGITLKSRYVRLAFWPKYWQAARTIAEPPEDVYGQMAALLKEPFQREWSKKTIEWVMKTAVDESASHPGLASRLRALGQEPVLPPAIETSAAEFFFGASYPARVKEVTGRWQDLVRPGWQEAHQSYANAVADLENLEKAMAQKSPTPVDLLSHAILVGIVRDEEEAAELYKPLLDAHGKDSAVLFHAGRNLLQRGDSSGQEMIERAMRMDEEWVPKGCAAICCYLESVCEMERMAPFAARLRRREQFVAEAEAQLGHAGKDAILLPHDIEPEGVAKLTAVLAAFSQVGRAYLVCRRLPGLPNRKYYYVCVDWKALAIVTNSNKLLAQIAASVSFAGERAWFFWIDGDWRFRERLKKVQGSLVYKRPFFASLRGQRPGRGAATPASAERRKA